MLMWQTAIPGSVELLFSTFMPDSGQAAATPFSYSDMALVSDPDSTCELAATSTDYCGLWVLPCSNGMGLFDEMQTLAIIGAPDATTHMGAGSLIQTKTVFDGGNACSEQSEALSIKKQGYWSTSGDGPAQDTLELLLNFPSVSVTPKSQGYVDSLNSVCSCGGVWELNRERVLTSCPAGSCLNGQQIFGSAVLGVPGYGLIIRAGDQLRLTDLAINSTLGYMQPFTINNLPLNNVDQCMMPPKIDDLCGRYTQPCQSYSLESPELDYQSSFEYIEYSGEYQAVTDTYAPGVGCDADPFFRVEQTGSVSRSSFSRLEALLRRHFFSTVHSWPLRLRTQRLCFLLDAA